MLRALPVALGLVLLAPLAAPLGLDAACAPREARTVTLDGALTILCVADVPLLRSDARITVETPGGSVEVPRAGLRTLAGHVQDDPTSWVRLVEAPGYLAGVVQKATGWYWLHPDGTVRTQGPVALHHPFADPSALGAPVPIQGRLQLWADQAFLADWGDRWHLYALTIINNVDGAFRGQIGYGLAVTGVQGWARPDPPFPRQSEAFDHVQMLSGTDQGISPLGYASLSLSPLPGSVGISWVRASPALARPVPYYGGPYEGSLFGATVVSVHELGHNLGHQHDPWYAGGQDGLPEAVCTAYGGWRGEAQACLHIGAWWRPVNLAYAAGWLTRSLPDPAMGPAGEPALHVDA